MNVVNLDGVWGSKRLCGVSFVLGCAFMLAVAACSIGAVAWVQAARVSKLHSARDAAVAAAHHAQAAPWGHLQSFELPFANPNRVYPDYDQRRQAPKWLFENATEDQVVRFLATCDLPRLHREVLLNRKYWNISSNGCVITPPDQLLWYLTPQSREQIYTVLGKWPVNYPQALPFHFSDEGMDLRLRQSGLPPASRQMVERLTYRKWGELCFSDLEVAEDLLSPAEFQALLESLYAIPAYALRLHVDPDADIGALVKYWGKGGRERRIEPLLKALSKVPGGESINVTYLLPPFPRLRLYTYPDAWKDTTASRQDCFYSALNFFNEIENTNLLDPVYAQRLLDAEYTPVKENPCFGDVLILCNPEGLPVHACVYIADNYVFTKNGINPGAPWVLMRMPDMLPTYFAPGKPGRILCLRHKEPVPALNAVAATTR